MNTHALDGTSAKLKILRPNFSRSQMEEYIISEKFDVIQLQSMWDLRYHIVAKTARKHRIPYIITPRGMLEPWCLSQKKWKKKLAMTLYQMKDIKRSACVFTTAEMEALHVRDLGVDVPMVVIPNGIETDGYPCRISKDKVKKQILFLSRIHIKKGIELLIDAFDRIIKKNTDMDDWTVAIVGNGEEGYIRELKRKVEDLNLRDKVKILAPVFGDAKVKLYQESSIFCLPSYSENFGMVIAEAMSCGVPCITTNGTPWQLLNGEVSTMGANLDILGKNRKTGWCIDLNVDNLEKVLLEAMTMKTEALYEMGQKGNLLVQENFNYKSVARKVMQLYSWLLDGGQTPAFVYEI